jgi:3-oxoacyl-[acyl-carrier protein] reductase
MDLGIKGKIALVAASSQGLGLATALELAQEGCLVSLNSRSLEKLTSARSQFPPDLQKNIHLFAGDISEEKTILAWVKDIHEKLGVPEILVTNTGGPPASTALETTDAQWEEGLQSTLLNIVRLVRAVAPGMKEKKFGRIVHITSLVARDPNDVLTISSTFRSGINSLTKLQARQLGPDGITVNAVLPGHARTDRQIHLAEIEAKKSGATQEEIFKKKADIIPLRRIGEASEIAAVIAFLCSQKASYVTGENILVDGGVSRSV